mgnify:FL=1
MALRSKVAPDGTTIPASVSVIVATALAVVAVAIGFSIAALPIVILIGKGVTVASLADAGAIIASLSTPLLAIVGILASLGSRRPSEPVVANSTTTASNTTEAPQPAIVE